MVWIAHSLISTTSASIFGGDIHALRRYPCTEAKSALGTEGQPAGWWPVVDEIEWATGRDILVKILNYATGDLQHAMFAFQLPGSTRGTGSLRGLFSCTTSLYTE